VVLSKREKYIGIGAVAAIAILVLDELVVSPYYDQLDALSTGITQAKQQIDQNNLLFERQRVLQKVWTSMQSGGLQVDESQADSQAQLAILQWAGRSDMSVTALKTEHVSPEKDFLVLTYDVTATGSTPGLAHMLWALETATIPICVNEIQISSRPENTDNLTVRMNVSTLSLPQPGSTGDTQ
jgi:type II secretion system (T2SS) protein M